MLNNLTCFDPYSSNHSPIFSILSFRNKMADIASYLFTLSFLTTNIPVVIAGETMYSFKNTHLKIPWG